MLSESRDCVLFVEEPSSHLKCSICGQCYIDPVINVTCGHTFCRRCAENSSQCPDDGIPCEKDRLVVNKLVVGQIEDLLIYCRFGTIKQNGDGYTTDASGCQETLLLGKRREHEDVCKFAQVLCPNNPDRCGKFRKSEMDGHLKDCLYSPCKHRLKGCEYVGRSDDVKMHVYSCGYRGVSRTISVDDFNDSVKVLTDVNKEMKEQVGCLLKRVSTLEKFNESLASLLGEYKNSLDNLNQKFDVLQSTVAQVLNSKNKPYNSTSSTDRRPRSTSSSRLSLSGSPNSSLHVETWEMPFQFKCIGTLRGHQGAVCALATRKHELYSGAADCMMKIWDLQNLSKGCVRTIGTQSKAVHCMIATEEFLYTACEDMALRMWNIGTWTEHMNCDNAHDNTVCAMVLTKDYLFTSSFSLIKVWDAKSLSLCHTISGLHHWVRGLALNRSKDLLYSGSHNTIDIWQASGDFALRGKIDHTFGSIYSLVVTEKYLIAGTYNRNIQLFDHSKQHVVSLQGHIGTVTSLQAAPSGRFLFSGSTDRTVRVWNLENMLPIQILQRHQDGINSIILHDDFLLSGSDDMDIKIYRYFQMYMGQAANT